MTADASFRRPVTPPADMAADETAAARPRAVPIGPEAALVDPSGGLSGNGSGEIAQPASTPEAVQPVATPEAAPAGRTAPPPPEEHTPAANAPKSPPENGKQTRRPRVTAARRNAAAAAAGPAAAAAPAGGQTHSATMAAFRRPAAATGEQPVSRPNAVVSGGQPVAQESMPISRPGAAAVLVAPSTVVHEQPANRPSIKSTPAPAAKIPAPTGGKTAVKARPDSRTAPQAAPAAQQESRHVPRATLSLAQPDIKPVTRPTLQAKPIQTTSTSKRPQRAADKPSRRPPARTPANAKTMPAGDAAATSRPSTPSKPK